MNAPVTPAFKSRYPSQNAEAYKVLDALDVGDTWTFTAEEMAKFGGRASVLAYYYQNRSGRVIRTHPVPSGFMFVRIE